MKKAILLLCSAIVSYSSIAQVVRNGLTEEFCSSTCPPCKTFSDSFHIAVVSVNANTPDAHINVISYQMNWPSPNNDAGYNGHGNSRRSYYNLGLVPRHFVNGVEAPANYTTQSLTYELLNSKTAASEFEITGSYVIRMSDTALLINVSVKPLVTKTGTYSVHIAATERHYVNPATTVGLTDYYNVMRKMFPNGAGTSETSWVANVSKTYSFTESSISVVNSPAQGSFDFWGNPFMGDLIVFVQDDMTKAVVQSQVIPASWPTSVADVEKINNVLIYPNPAREMAHIGFTIEKASRVDCIVYDATGKIVYSQRNLNLPAGASQINMSTANFANGMYHVSLVSETDKYSGALSVLR